MSPAGQRVYTSNKATEGRFNFVAIHDGVHTLCLSNRMSSMTEKVVMFSMHKGEAPPITDVAKTGARARSPPPQHAALDGA